MPIYEYLCEGCGMITELMQKMTDPAPKTCPECGSHRIAKLVSRSAFQLKGGGWYADLYASRKTEGTGGKDAKPAAAAPKAADGSGTSSAPATAGESQRAAGAKGKGEG